MEILNITYKNPRPLKFKGKFQEADKFNRNPPPDRVSTEKWAKSGLLDGIYDPWVRQLVSIMLDQQEKTIGRANKAQSCRTIKWNKK